ncbi:MAG TPA: hypothetical protein VF917_04750 [Steroidobacteraceae bacterium]|jgi:hypothetical protein
MSLKTILFTIGCLVAWFILLPMLLIVGGTALFAYAIFAELGEFLLGNPSKTLDKSAASEIARRMCCGVQVRGTRRFPPP